MKQQKVLLETIPGIGEATINVILSEFSQITHFKNAKALATFMDVAPRNREPGASLRSRASMSKMGRSKIYAKRFLCRR